MDKRKFPMHSAAQWGHQERVQHLIERGVSVDSRDDKDRTPLHLAALWGQYEVVQLLISNHCNVDLMDQDGRTPVMLAAGWDRKDVVDLLLQRGAQVHCVDKDGFTLLHRASVSGWVDVVQRIVESGETDVNAATLSGETSLMHAAKLGHVNVAVALIRVGADVNAANLSGETSLMHAARWGHVDVAVLLIRVGADVHRMDKWKRTALHRASAADHTVVQLLLKEEGLDLNPQDDEGDTPLHKACCQAVVKQLLTAGADTNIKNIISETALSVHIRRDKSTLEVIRLFVQHGFFFEDCDYALISQNPVLKEHVLKDSDLCTQSIVNKFHRQSLPALYSNPNLVKKLPCIKNFNLNTQHVQDIENFVKWDIQTNTFCNIPKARPLVLGVLCVQSLLAYPTGVKGSASPGVSDSNSPLKKARHN